MDRAIADVVVGESVKHPVRDLYCEAVSVEAVRKDNWKYRKLARREVQ